MSGGSFALAIQDTTSLLLHLKASASARAIGIAVLMGGSAAAVLTGAMLAGVAARHANAQDGAYAAVALAVGAGRTDLVEPVRSPSLLGGFTLRASLGGDFNPAAAPLYFKGGSRDLQCLTEAVYYEARGESLAGEEAVAQVVINRVRHPAFPKSICGVVYQHDAAGHCQFSFACDGSVEQPREARAWRTAGRVAQRALDGFVMTPVGQATHFHTLNVAPAWGGRMMQVAQIGLHVFYRFGGMAGSPDAFRGKVRASGPTDGVMAMLNPAADAATNAIDAAIAAAAQADLAPAAQAVATAAAPTAAPATPATAPVATPVAAAAVAAAAIAPVVATVTPVADTGKPAAAPAPVAKVS